MTTATIFRPGQSVSIGDIFDVNGEALQALKSFKKATALPRVGASYKLVPGLDRLSLLQEEIRQLKQKILGFSARHVADFLVGDGSPYMGIGTDNYDAFTLFFQQHKNAGPTTLILPSGYYYCSKTLNLDSLHIVIKWENGACIMNPAGVRGMNIWRKTYSEYYELDHPTFLAVGKVEDGMIMSDDEQEKQWRQRCNVPDNATNYAGQGLGLPAAGQPARVIQSLDPTRYQHHGIWSNAIVTIERPSIIGYSGSGILLHAMAIGGITADAPIGSNSSMSQVWGGGAREIALCGFGLTIVGNDASQASVIALSVRNCMINFVGDSLEGNHYWATHSSTALWGDYWDVSPNASSTYTGCYIEGTPMTSKFFGYTAVNDGRMDTCPIDLGPFASFKRARNVTAQKMAEMQVDDNVAWNNDSNYHRFMLQSRSKHEVHIQGRIGGESSNSGLIEFYGAGVTGVSGRKHSRPGVGFGHGITNQGQYQGVSPNGLNPPAGERWFIGDKLEATNKPESYPLEYRCLHGGFYGQDSYASVVGVRLECVKQQVLRTEKPSDFIKIYDTFKLGASTYQVVGPPVSLEDGRQEFSVHSLDTFEGFLMPEYPKAKWVAVGRGRGTTEERPTQQQFPDAEVLVGWDYLNTKEQKVQTCVAVDTWQ